MYYINTASSPVTQSLNHDADISRFQSTLYKKARLRINTSNALGLTRSRICNGFPREKSNRRQVTKTLQHTLISGLLISATACCSASTTTAFVTIAVDCPYCSSMHGACCNKSHEVRPHLTGFAWTSTCDIFYRYGFFYRYQKIIFS